MIHEISPFSFDNTYQAYVPQHGDFVLSYQGDTLLAGLGEGGIAYPVYDEAYMKAESCVYLFSVDSCRFFAARLLKKPEGFDYVGIHQIREFGPRHLVFAGLTGYHLHRWYSSRRYCGACGQKMVHGSLERVMTCPDCAQLEYPQLMPAVIVGVIDGEKLLLTKYAPRGDRQAGSRPALVAGYTEIGESLEETVRREVREETGLEVDQISYYKSQPWGLTGSLLAGFYARVKGESRVRLNEEELSEAIFVPRQEIDQPYLNVSLTNEMICRFRDIGGDCLLSNDSLRQQPYKPMA